MIHELAKKVCEGDFSFLYAFDFQLTQYTLCQLLISPSPKIVGGSTAERDKWKFIVRFAYIGCAGSIISPHWIITGLKHY